MNLKETVLKFIPSPLLYFYHYSLARLSSLIYRNPSSKMVVIGITGTAGKSTTTWLAGKIFSLCGLKTGWTSTISFKIKDKEIPNALKMTMPGRFFLSRTLKQMADNGIEYAFVETTSQGISQARHLPVHYDGAIFTNLSPEHIESHGSFEKYKKEKLKLFAFLSKCKHKTIKGKKIPKVIIANLDDKNAVDFLKFPVDQYYGYTLGRIKVDENFLASKNIKLIEAKDINCTKEGSSFRVGDNEFKTNLIGEFNIYNILACLCLADYFSVPFEKINEALSKIKFIPGRMEQVCHSPFSVFVDYAHTPHELEKVYKTLKERGDKLICVLGSAGGGRDKWRRPELGKIAANYCQYIILTDEDPYDENPQEIIDEIEKGLLSVHNSSSQYFKILDRTEAIKKAISLAKPDSQIIITGKGSELCICGPNNKKIPYNDKETVQKILTPCG